MIFKACKFSVILLFLMVLFIPLPYLFADDSIYDLSTHPSSENMKDMQINMKQFKDGSSLKVNPIENMSTNEALEQILKDNNIDFPAIKRVDKIYYFVSFSMPEVSIKQAIVAAEKIGAPFSFVIRGFVKEEDKNINLRNTALRISKLIGGYKVEFVIDPYLFSKYKVGDCNGCSRIPTLVYAKNINSSCENCDDNNIEAVKISGNTTIDYALIKIRDKYPEVKKYIASDQ